MDDPQDDDPGHPRYWQNLFGEASTPFEAEPDQPVALDTLRALYSAVLSNYDFTCAMTGARFAPPSEFLHDELAIAAIRPLTAGGMLHVSNFLCLERHAAEAFRDGYISVGPGLELIVDLSQLDPELLERLNPLGKLTLPQVEIAHPDRTAIAFHREHVFLGHL
ncbi:hypothetical protein [Devosia sp. 2618]|uniref:hypothetical protein n=1 Tax=Devosia sp. 2618 TaxID=3156454 RepID=UPI003396D923